MPCILNKIFHTISEDVPERNVRGLISTALEAGIGYWAAGARFKLRGDLKIIDFKPGGSEAIKVDGYWPSIQLVPFVDGCYVSLDDRETGETFKNTLNRCSMKDGLEVMAAKYPKHFRDFINENDDADTADVFVQCVLFGSIVFG